MKKALRIGSWVLTIGAILALVAFISVEQSNLPCSELEIHLDGPQGIRFLDEDDLRLRITDMGSPVVGENVSKADIAAFERAVRDMQEIEFAEVYRTIDGRVVVEATQRCPIVRVFNADSTSFYLDEKGFPMPLSWKYTARVPVVTGNVNEPVAGISVPEILANDSLEDARLMDDIWQMAQFIREDPLWKAQVQHIHVNGNGEFELLPRVGGHRIIFGSTDRIEEKFENLYLLYTKGFHDEAWREYDTINLKYKDQIVCTKKN